MPVFHKLTALLSFLLLAAGVSQAQPMGAAPTVRFSTLSWDKAIRGIYFLQGEERVDLSIPNGAPSKLYKTTAGAPLVFYRQSDQLDENGEPIGIPIASTNLKPGNAPNLLIFFEAQNQSEQYRIVPIINEAQNANRDIYQLHNISRRQIVAKFDDQEISLKPNENLIINAPQTDRPNFGVMMAIQADSDKAGEWELVYKAFWPYRQGRSGLVFITGKPGREDQINVRRFYVSTPPPPQS